MPAGSISVRLVLEGSLLALVGIRSNTAVLHFKGGVPVYHVVAWHIVRVVGYYDFVKDRAAFPWNKAEGIRSLR